MAVDTEAKRISAVNLLVGIRSIFPDGTIAQNDRQSTALVYSGILSDTPSVGGGAHGMNDLSLLYRKKKSR